MEENLSGATCLLVLLMGGVILVLLTLLIKLLDRLDSRATSVVVLSNPSPPATGSGCTTLLSLLIMLAGTIAILGLLAH